MGPENMDSIKCLSLGACSPIGGQSVYTFIGKYDDPFYLISIAMDTTSLFLDRNNGNIEVGIGMSIILGVVDALKVKSITNEGNIIKT